MTDKLKAVGMGSMCYEWTYLACSRYWLQMFELAPKIFGDSRSRTMLGADI